MSGPESFDFNAIPPQDEQPLSKEQIVERLKTNGVVDPAFLASHIEQLETKYRTEGRVDAHSEALRDKAHILKEAGFFLEAIDVMQEVLNIAEKDEDTETIEETKWIIGRLSTLIEDEREKALTELRNIINDKVEFLPPERMTLEESGEKVYRDEVIVAYRKLGEMERAGPVDRNAPEVIEAKKLFERWDVQMRAETKGDEFATLKHEIDMSMIFIDSGFYTQDLLREIFSNIAVNEGDIEKDPNNPKLVEQRKYVANILKRIRQLMKEE